MRGKFALLLLATIIALSHQISTPESSHYVGGVVEFTPENYQQPSEQRIEGNMEAYMQIIASEEAQDVDILVFPESTLNTRSFSTFVPHPDDEIAPCEDENYEFFLRNISCAARTHKKYIVINLTEKHLCTEEEQEALNDDRPCAEDGLSYYNTNVVMNRNGTVVSRYRKFHPFGERGINTTLVSDISTFTTDFGVTFGHFICFDIIFDEPPLKLLEDGVKDFLFPTMWFSELPYLTAVQVQYMWAWKHNVNFLGAGANNPEVGSTGSGIFAGRKGPLTYVMSSTPMRRLLVANVPKAHTLEGPYTHDPVAVKQTEEQMLDLHLKRDHLDIYTTKLVNVSQEKGSEKLCFDTLCCDFDYELTFDDSLVTDESDYYRYHLAVFDGVRTYDNVATGGVLTCGLFACPSDDLESCATRFNASDNVVSPVTFTSIKISGAFPSKSHVLTMPNALDNLINPINFNEFHYEEGEERTEDGETYKDITLELTIPRNDLRTFGIYGRNFQKDGQDVTTGGASSLTPLAVIAFLASVLLFLQQNNN
ncbi:vanin-like protein 1 [Phlebotomus argentipes]|uniref:vanin-like protein 1 n=1 Tax=Phlebotomus argentipes TaxID=94469 RepID=UPI002892C8E1|nr:vanin-like protein 1 [Phlebotomus argentipes]